MENDIPGFLQKASFNLSGYLEKVLPSIYEDWWQDGVLASLSFNQRRRFEQGSVSGQTNHTGDKAWHRLLT